VIVRFALATAIATLALCASAGAATLEVTSQADSGPGSLGETILEAGPGDTIVIPPGTYLLTNGDTLIEQGNVLRGAGVGQTTIVPSGGGDALDQITYSGLSVAPARQAGEDDDSSQIETKAQIIALVATLAIFLLILELVRRRRLVERYALLWMSVALALFVLAIWTDGLEEIADLMGIEEPANAIFILAFGTVFLLLLNFSVATSRLSEETKILAQEAARLEQELRAARGETPTRNQAPQQRRGSATPR
jgi:hypothetical protein